MNTPLSNANLDDALEKLVYDTHSEYSILSNFNLINNPKLSKVELSCSYGLVRATHTGSLTLNGRTIQPVFYAPESSTNLISAAQLEDHGFRIVHMDGAIQIREEEKIFWRFRRNKGSFTSFYLNSRNPDNLCFLNAEDTDWHILLGHPSDLYLKQFLQRNNIQSSRSPNPSKECEVCKQCKLKRRPHKNPIPSASRPFEKLHTDILQLSPQTKSGSKYVLVIVDDYSRYNRLYFLRRKSQTADRILKYIQEIKEKTGKLPAYLHSDRGGEYTSAYLQSKLDALGISIEQGPADSPQTNGLAERFNQTLILKIRCLLAQSSVPISLWDEAARFASSLINHLPSKALNWSCPMSVLEDNLSMIEPKRDFSCTLPFGLKVQVYQRNDSVPVSNKRTYSFLGYEPFSDSARFLDNRSHKIFLSRHYSIMMPNFQYNDPNALKKSPKSLPMIISDDLPIKNNPPKVTIRIGRVHRAIPSESTSTNDLPRPTSQDATRSSESTSINELPRSATQNATNSNSGNSPAPPDTRTYRYVPYFEKAPNDIDSSVDPRNILTSTRRSNNNPSANYCTHQEQNTVDIDSINYVMKIMNLSPSTNINSSVPTCQFQLASTVPQLRRGVKVKSSVAQLRRGVGVISNCATEDLSTEARPERKRSRM